MTQIIAVDWSGRVSGAGEAIWLARVCEGRLVELENGRGRAELIDEILSTRAAEPRTVVGLDFAFAFPAWYSRLREWRTGREVWDAMRDEADHLLGACEPPFWGRPDKRRTNCGEALRETERSVAGQWQAKSVFQIGGAGAVGTGSLRGMPYLADLADAGFAIWPFDDPGWPCVVEIYPRALTGPVVKARHRARREHLARHFGEQNPILLERAAGSQDAFDAAVSALVMARHCDELESLPAVGRASSLRLEGIIWTPGA